MKVQLIIFFCVLMHQSIDAQIKHDSTYDSIIHRADSLFQAENYSQAEENYRKAHSIKESTYTDKMIMESMRYDVPYCGDSNKNYEKIVSYADSLYVNEEFEKALKFYDRALLFRPNDQHVKSRVSELNGRLNR